MSKSLEEMWEIIQYIVKDISKIENHLEFRDHPEMQEIARCLKKRKWSFWFRSKKRINLEKINFQENIKRYEELRKRQEENRNFHFQKCTCYSHGCFLNDPVILKDCPYHYVMQENKDE